MKYLVIAFFLLAVGSISALKCAQCRGWHGSFPGKYAQTSDCDNRNNHCQTDQFCVKIIDPMAPGVPYTTFKLECWFQPNLLVSPTNNTLVSNNMCYSMVDGSVPPKTWKYCFCNDKDYCNSSFNTQYLIVTYLMLISSFQFLNE